MKSLSIILPALVFSSHAAPNSSFTYIAVSPSTKGKTIWLQPVTDQEYNSIK